MINIDPLERFASQAPKLYICQMSARQRDNAKAKVEIEVTSCPSFPNSELGLARKYLFITKSEQEPKFREIS